MSEAGSEPVAQRTDPLGLIARAAESLRQMVLPLIAIAFAMRSEMATYPAIAAGVALVVLVIALISAWLSWSRLTYTVGADDIRIDSGVVARAARAVPYERIQDVSLEQALVPRLLGLVEVRFETGAGGKDDLRLAYLSQDRGAALRELVRARREHAPDGSAADIETPEAASPTGELLYAIAPRRLITFGLFEFSLVAVAALVGAVQQFDFLLSFDPWDLDEWQARLAGPGQWFAGLGRVAQFLGIVFAVCSVLIVGFATGLVRTVLRDWNFILENSDRGLRRRRGLLTRTDVTMPLHRVQALRIDTGFIRKRFGWHALKIISLASDSGAANHDAAPFARLEEIAPIASLCGFDLPPPGTRWQGPSSRYRFDRWCISAALSALVVAALAMPVFGDWAALGLIIPVACSLALHAWLRWHRDRHARDARQLYNRAGWFSPRTTIVQQSKLQSVEIVRGPLARRRGYAHLHLGVAGGVFRIHGMDIGEALQWRTAVLASIAESDFSELLGVARQPRKSAQSGFSANFAAT